MAPGRLQAAIAAGLARRREGAEALLDAIAAGKASARLLQEQPVALALRQANPPRLEDRLSRCWPDCLRPTRSSPRCSTGVAPGSGRRRSRHRPEEGAAVFEKNCGICHQLGGKGAQIGPQLDGIGSRGLDRLVEDILDPNRNVDQTFRVTNLALKNGQVVSGLLLREEGEILVLADAQGKEVRVPKIVRRRAQDLAALADAGQPRRSDHRGRLQPPARLPALEARAVRPAAGSDGIEVAQVADSPSPSGFGGPGVECRRSEVVPAKGGPVP